MLAPVCPVLQAKVSAPLAVRVVELPAQMATGDAATLTATGLLTDTVTLAGAEHPF